MKLISITDKKNLNDFVGRQQNSRFLQSWQWGEFQEKIHGKVFRLGIEQEGNLVAAALLVKKPLPLGLRYFYCPRGPVINEECGMRNAELLKLFFQDIIKIAGPEKAIFLRFEPTFPISPGLAKRSGAGNFQFPISKTIDVQPRKTSVLDLTNTEEELLNAMHRKTRYNIRLAKKKGVRISKANPDRFDDFWKIMAETVKRDEFRLHPKKYYLSMLAVKGVDLMIAEYKRIIIAGIILSFFGDTVAYLHGASSNENRNVMAPFLLQWSAIKRAKELGYKYYDLNGIDADKWPGVTRFKEGFGGREIKFPGTFDLVINPLKYKFYNIARKIRRGMV